MAWLGSLSSFVGSKHNKCGDWNLRRHAKFTTLQIPLPLSVTRIKLISLVGKPGNTHSRLFFSICRFTSFTDSNISKICILWQLLCLENMLKSTSHLQLSAVIRTDIDFTWWKSDAPLTYFNNPLIDVKFVVAIIYEYVSRQQDMFTQAACMNSP